MTVAADDKDRSRRVYGRGFHDGLRAAAAEQREPMNASKLASAERSISTTARKVLEAVPIAEAWSTGRIVAELKRRGINMDPSMVDGCLNNLRGHGLVREPLRGSFITVQARPALAAVAAPANVAEASEVATAPEVAADKERSPLDQMAELAQAARDIAAKASLLAEQIEAAALDVEERMQRIASDTTKLKQLQQLLRSIEQA